MNQLRARVYFVNSSQICNDWWWIRTTTAIHPTKPSSSSSYTICAYEAMTCVVRWYICFKLSLLRVEHITSKKHVWKKKIKPLLKISYTRICNIINIINREELCGAHQTRIQFIPFLNAFYRPKPKRVKEYVSLMNRFFFLCQTTRKYESSNLIQIASPKNSKKNILFLVNIQGKNNKKKCVVAVKAGQQNVCDSTGISKAISIIK